MKKTEWVQKLLPEFVSIVFAVTLALLLNEWRQQSKEHQRVNRMIQTLIDETQSNLADVEQAFAYREKLLEDIGKGIHVANRVPLASLTFDPLDDRAFEESTKTALLANGSYEPDVQILRSEDIRYLRIGKRVGRMEIVGDTLFIFGDFNIQLRSASIKTDTWDLATVTGSLVNMDYEVIRKMSQINVLATDYESASKEALSLLYSGEDVVSVMEDMLWMERELTRNSRELLQLLDVDL